MSCARCRRLRRLLGGLVLAAGVVGAFAVSALTGSDHRAGGLHLPPPPRPAAAVPLTPRAAKPRRGEDLELRAPLHPPVGAAAGERAAGSPDVLGDFIDLQLRYSREARRG